MSVQHFNIFIFLRTRPFKRKFHKIYVTLNQYSVSKMLPYTNDKFPAIKTNADFNCNADAIDVLISLAEAESGYFKAVGY